MSAEQPDAAQGPAPGVTADRTAVTRSAPSTIETVLAVPTAPTLAVTAWPAALTAALAGAITFGAFAGWGGALAAVLLADLLLAWGWPILLDLPSPRGTTSVIAAGGVAAALAVSVTRTEPRLDWLAFALAGTLVLSFVHQLARRDGRPRLVQSLAGTVTAVMALASLACVLALPGTLPGARGLLGWALAVTVALVAPLVVRLAGLPESSELPLGTVAAAVMGLVCGALLAGQGVLAGALAGGASGFVALVVHLLLSTQPAAGRVPAWVALAVAPLSCAGLVGYLPLRLLLG